MGIKGLSKFLKSYISDTITEKKLSELAGKIIAIDANYFMYKYTISTNDYIHKFRRQYEHLISNQIKVVYVFDGKPPKEKKKVLEKRKEMNKKKNIDISLDKITELKRFFDSKSISYLECSSEADFICCKLSEYSIIDGCISDDMDFLTLGCKRLYRDYYQHSDVIMEYNLEKILEQFTKSEFIDICIFLGCDYCDRVHDFVNRSLDINVFELFKQYKNLENVWKYLRNNDMFLFVDDEKEKLVMEKWGKTREILNNNIELDSKSIEVISKIDISKYNHFRLDNGFSEKLEITKKDFIDFSKKPIKKDFRENQKYFAPKKCSVDHWDKKNYAESKVKKVFDSSNKFSVLS